MKTPGELVHAILTAEMPSEALALIAARDAEVRAAAVEECAKTVDEIGNYLAPDVWRGTGGYGRSDPVDHAQWLTRNLVQEVRALLPAPAKEPACATCGGTGRVDDSCEEAAEKASVPCPRCSKARP